MKTFFIYELNENFHSCLLDVLPGVDAGNALRSAAGLAASSHLIVTKQHVKDSWSEKKQCFVNEDGVAFSSAEVRPGVVTPQSGFSQQELYMLAATAFGLGFANSDAVNEALEKAAAVRERIRLASIKQSKKVITKE